MRPAPPGHSAGCRAGRAREWGEVRVSRTPSVKEMPPALVTSSNRRDSKKIEVPAAGQGLLARHGSVRAPALSRQEPPGLLRSFSLRRKGPEDFLHTSSMPCLAAPLTGRDRNSNFSVGRASGGGQPAASTTPASAGLVLNSLAYQVLTLHCTALHCTAPYYTALHYTAPAAALLTRRYIVLHQVLPEQTYRGSRRGSRGGAEYGHRELAPAGSYGSTGSTSYSSSASHSSSSASSSLSLHSPPSPVTPRSAN